MRNHAFRLRAAIAGPCILALTACAAFAQATAYEPPSASAALLATIDFSKAAALDESYRAQFRNCDVANTFRGVAMTGNRRCSGDPNNVRALLKLKGGAVYYDSKMALDVDGSHKAWTNPGAVDLRHTWFRWKAGSTAQADQVDPDRYPFVVIPIAGLKRKADKAFRKLTGVDRGDFGVVVYKDRWTPVLVADGGPHNKLGEASSAVFKAVGEDRCETWNAAGWCEKYRDFSVDANVVTILFPGSRRGDLTPSNALSIMRKEACQRLQLSGCP